jgi:glycosyltransferase involved in cell wall biosynthesis
LRTKVLFIESGTTGGGSFESLYQHIKHIDFNNYEPIIVCLNRTKYNQLWEGLGARVISLDDRLYTINNKKIRLLNKIYYRIIKLPFGIFKWYIIFLQYTTIKALVRLVKHSNIDIIHLNDQPLRDLYGLIVADMTETLCFSHLRSMRTKAVPKGFAEYSNSIVAKYIANSSATAIHWSGLGLNKEKITIVPNALDIKNKLDKDIRLIKYIDKKIKGKIVLCCIANFSEVKGHKFLIESFVSLITKNNNYILLLSGKGNCQDEIKAMVKHYDINDYVEFLGYINNPYDVLEKSDILIVPSKSESFGRVILEAWQAGVAVIATKVGGIPEVIQDNKNGILIEYGNIKDLSTAIITLSENRSLNNTLTKNGKITLEQRYTTKGYFKLIDNLYACYK